MISPWNFPLHLSSRSIAPAIALGNSVVIKPASDTPVTGGILLAKIYEEAGLPPGVLNVIIAQGSAIGDEFVRHPVPRVISFTGSTEVGRHIAKSAAESAVLKRVVLELGGNSPCVILDDADLDLALDIAAFGKFLHQGQICMAINRLVVDARVYDTFVARFAERVRGLKVGNPADADTVIGPLINQHQLDGLLDRIKKARAEGTRQVVGGEPDGLVLPPHMFADVANDMSIAREELFGPVVSVIKVRGMGRRCKWRTKPRTACRRRW
jgi:aldehyde dehydrogenase (NAD+)